MPKDNEVDEKVIEAVARALCKSRSLGPEVLHIDATGEMPVDGTVIAMIDGNLAERPAFFGWRKQVVHAIAALEAADHAAKVAELRAEVERLRKSNELYSFAMNTAGIDELKRRADAAAQGGGEK